MKKNDERYQSSAYEGLSSMFKLHKGYFQSTKKKDDLDIIARVKFVDNNWHIASWNTTDLESRHYEATNLWIKKIEILRDVIIAQKKILDYNGHYIAYLHGQLSDHEFEGISQNFETDKTKIDLDALKERVNVLLNTTGLSFENSILADIFNVTEDDVIDAVKTNTRKLKAQSEQSINCI